MLPCASRDAGLEPDVAKRIVMAAMDVAWASFWGGKPGQENLVFVAGKVAPAGDEKVPLFLRRVRLRSNRARLVPPLCSATSDCSCVRDSMRLLTLWLQIAV